MHLGCYDLEISLSTLYIQSDFTWQLTIVDKITMLKFQHKRDESPTTFKYFLTSCSKINIHCHIAKAQMYQ